LVDARLGISRVIPASSANRGKHVIDTSRERIESSERSA
jgi:hypothetical protein